MLTKSVGYIAKGDPPVGHRNSGTALLLDRPTAEVRRGAPAPCRVWSEAVTEEGTFGDGPQGPASPSSLRAWAPTLAVLSTVYLIEGYRWLGVIQLGGTGIGSLLFGTAGLATVALIALVAALFLRWGRQAGAPVFIQDLAVAGAASVTVATGTALVVGGPLWRDVAGVTYLFLAATALSAVLLGERRRRSAVDHQSHRTSRIG
jgi:hypothetical protein